MTTEEQLDWLCRLRSEIYVYMPKEWLIPMNNALDMAIKALEQEPTTKNDLGVDCIDRQAAITFVCKNTEEILKDTMPLEVKLSDDYLYENVAKIMRNPKILPSVTPQEPKIGHWIDCDNSNDYSADGYDCSVCGVNAEYATSYCPNCGAKMIEPQEGSEKE